MKTEILAYNTEAVSLVGKNWNLRHAGRMPPVSFFSGQADSFNILCQYLGFMKLPKNPNFLKKLSQKLALLLSVLRETGHKKKKPVSL